MIEQIWTEFHHRLLTFIMNKVGNTAIAEDILQDVFIQVINKIDSLDDKTKLSSWLYQICRNKIIDHYRTKKITTVSIDEFDMFDLDLPEQEKSGIENCIRILISELPANFNAILLESEIENITQKDIAENQNLSLPAVKSRLKRGRSLLKEKLLRCCTIQFSASSIDTECKNHCGCES